MNDVTIVSVCYHSQKYLDLNYQILHNQIKEWVVINNGNDKLESHFTQIKGCKRVIRRPRISGAGAIHHACGLNKIRSFNFKTRYILVLDPDCYIFRPIKDIIEHVQTNDISFFEGFYYWYSVERRITVCIRFSLNTARNSSASTSNPLAEPTSV